MGTSVDCWERMSDPNPGQLVVPPTQDSTLGSLVFLLSHHDGGGASSALVFPETGRG